MPVKVMKKRDKYRVVESATGKIVRNAAGTALDGGGHRTKIRAVAQVNAINLASRRRQGKPAPLPPRERANP